MKLTYDELQVLMIEAREDYINYLNNLYKNNEWVETKILAIDGFIARLNREIIFNKIETYTKHEEE